MSRHGEHAVVVGASMGGLVAAAAIAPYYGRVTLIERDELPSVPAHRRGVPQSKHAHGLQPGGMQALESLLPGLVDELIAGGAPVGDVGQQRWFVGGGWLAPADAGAPGLGVTRPYLEHHVRCRVAALPGVTIRAGTQVTRPLAQAAQGRARIVGVEVIPTGGGDAEELRADLVIDAAGRASRLPDWLRELQYAAPEEDQVRCRMAYLSRRWRLREGALPHGVITVVTPAEKPEFGVAIAQEDGTHIVTLGGLLDGAPDRDDAAYLAFARSLPDPILADALEGAEPVTDLQPSRFPYSRRRRYDRLRAFPEGLLALGDSIASFNPMYGQGMSVAAIEAVALRDALAKGPLNALRFFKAAHRIEDVAWKISTGGDLRFDAVEGKRTPDMKLMNGYLDRLTLAARTDPVLTTQFLRVAGFMQRPETFFKPGVVRRSIRGSRAATRAALAEQARPAVTAVR